MKDNSTNEVKIDALNSIGSTALLATEMAEFLPSLKHSALTLMSSLIKNFFPFLRRHSERIADCVHRLLAHCLPPALLLRKHGEYPNSKDAVNCSIHEFCSLLTSSPDQLHEKGANADDLVVKKLLIFELQEYFHCYKKPFLIHHMEKKCPKGLWCCSSVSAACAILSQMVEAFGPSMGVLLTNLSNLSQTNKSQSLSSNRGSIVAQLLHLIAYALVLGKDSGVHYDAPTSLPEKHCNDAPSREVPVPRKRGWQLEMRIDDYMKKRKCIRRHNVYESHSMIAVATAAACAACDTLEVLITRAGPLLEPSDHILLDHIITLGLLRIKYLGQSNKNRFRAAIGATSFEGAFMANKKQQVASSIRFFSGSYEKKLAATTLSFQKSMLSLATNAVLSPYSSRRIFTDLLADTAASILQINSLHTDATRDDLLLGWSDSCHCDRKCSKGLHFGIHDLSTCGDLRSKDHRETLTLAARVAITTVEALTHARGISSSPIRSAVLDFDRTNSFPVLVGHKDSYNGRGSTAPTLGTAEKSGCEKKYQENLHGASSNGSALSYESNIEDNSASIVDFSRHSMPFPRPTSNSTHNAPCATADNNSSKSRCNQHGMPVIPGIVDSVPDEVARP